MASITGPTERTAAAPTGWRASAARTLRSAGLRAAFAALVMAGTVILLRDHGGLQLAELLVYDALRVAWAGQDASDRVVLVGATEKDITERDASGERRWGWPLRDGKLAELLERIASARPRAIGVDLYRDVPEPPGTERLNDVLRRHPEIFWVFKLKDDVRPGIPPPQALRGSDRAVLADVLADPDHVVRRGLLFADDGVTQYAGLAMALALAYLAPEKVGLQPADNDALRLGKTVIAPLDQSRGPYVVLDNRGYQVLLDYRGGPLPFRKYSLNEVAERGDLASLVRDRVVIVGVTAESVRDSFTTPFGTGLSRAEPINGITVHAHLVNQLVAGALEGRPPLDGLPRGLEDIWVVLWALGGATVGLLVRSTAPALAGGAAGLAAIGVAVFAAFGRGLLLPAVPAALAWVGAGTLTNQLLYAASNRARARLRQSFEHYLPPAVIDKLVKSDSLPELGGERREISVLFTDVAGFTTFSEGRDPAELAEITNRYFDGVCAAVFANEGLVNAFLGDGVLAFFGAPQPQPDHADRAVAAALAIARFTDGFSREQQARGIGFGHTRVGIHTGIAFVGNVGAQQRLQYTALGDILNTASRLEGLNKAIGTRICVSRDVTEKCREHRFRPVGAFIVKGRRGATEVFTPVDPQRTRPDALALYQAAYRSLETEAPEAAAQFGALYRDDPDDPCVAFHYRRLSDGERGVLIEMHEK
jgi:adenylate cyclase